MQKLVSMKIDKKAREKMAEPSTLLSDAPIYPYGLQLRLDEEALDKLGEDHLPEVGGTVMVLAKAKVTSVSSNESDSGKRRNVELQITDLCLEAAANDTKKSDADVLYGKATA